MWNEFCCLHSDEKIRYGCKLDAVDHVQYLLKLLQLAMIQKYLSGPVKGTVFQYTVFLSGKIREDTQSNGRFQIRMGREGTGQIAVGKIRFVDTCGTHQGVDHGKCGSLGVQILQNIRLGEIQRLSGGRFLRKREYTAAY